MTRDRIMAEIAEAKLVEELVNNCTIGMKLSDLTDLCQDIYLSLLEKDAELIETLYAKRQLKFFISRMILNNVKSRTSPYYKNYRRHTDAKAEIPRDL